MADVGIKASNFTCWTENSRLALSRTESSKSEKRLLLKECKTVHMCTFCTLVQIGAKSARSRADNSVYFLYSSANWCEKCKCALSVYFSRAPFAISVASQTYYYQSCGDPVYYSHSNR